MKKLLLYSLLLTLSIVYSCQKSDHNVENPPEPPGIPIEGVMVNTSVFGRVVDEKDQPLPGVTVTGGGKSTITDKNGIYILNEINLDQARGYLTAVKKRILQRLTDFSTCKKWNVEATIDQTAATEKYRQDQCSNRWRRYFNRRYQSGTAGECYRELHRAGKCCGKLSQSYQS